MFSDVFNMICYIEFLWVNSKWVILCNINYLVVWFSWCVIMCYVFIVINVSGE